MIKPAVKKFQKYGRLNHGLISLGVCFANESHKNECSHFILFFAAGANDRSQCAGSKGFGQAPQFPRASRLWRHAGFPANQTNPNIL
jgi:hypothetical protein